MSNIEHELVETLCVIQGREWTGLDDRAIESLLDLPIADLSLDSLERMEFVMQIEERYGIDLDERDVIACKFLRQYAELIRRQIHRADGRV